MRNFLVFLVLFLLTVSSSYAQNKKIIYEKYQANKVQKRASGHIKGHIVSLKYKKGLWHYAIKSANTKNFKLAYATMTHRKKLANYGDLVYSTIQNGKLKELFFIKKGNFKKKKIIKKRKKYVKKRKKIVTKPKKIKKYVKKTTIKVKKKKKLKKLAKSRRTKKHQILGIPTTESISLD